MWSGAPVHQSLAGSSLHRALPTSHAHDVCESVHDKVYTILSVVTGGSVLPKVDPCLTEAFDTLVTGPLQASKAVLAHDVDGGAQKKLASPRCVTSVCESTRVVVLSSSPGSTVAVQQRHFFFPRPPQNSSHRATGHSLIAYYFRQHSHSSPVTMQALQKTAVRGPFTTVRAQRR
jgi:hypothetical protein